MNRLFQAAIVLVGLLFATTGLAQTTDGETPAEEVTCDSFTGAAYGRCVAYCEAVDCETTWSESCDVLWAHIDDVLPADATLDCSGHTTPGECDAEAMKACHEDQYYAEQDCIDRFEGHKSKLVRCVERALSKFDSCLDRAGCL